jgi:hypothetical protein
MAITIQKRTRPTVNDPWSAWADTTDAAPYIDTDTVDYRVKSEILVEEVTNATTTSDGTGVFDIFMNAMNIHIDDQYTKNRITGTDYATVYLGAMQLAMTQATQWAKTQDMLENQTRKSEADADMAEINLDIANQTKANKINKSIIDDYIAEGTKDYKIATQQHGATKAQNEAAHVEATTTAMQEQVIDNRKIKALDSMADTYGTFGAGGLTLSTGMWSKYFEVVSALAGGASPTDTDQIEKVV